MKWFLEIFLMECKRVLSYRIDFWFQFGVIVCTEISIAYFLWSSIYGHQNVVSLGGYTFEQMLVYYAMIPFVVRLVKSSDDFNISREIYEGGINKYLIYPISYTVSKLIERAAFSTMAIAQMLIGLALLSFFIPITDHLTLQSFTLCLVFCSVSFVLYFLMSFFLEMFAFWFDSVWSLGVMLRFITMFLGGAMIPVSLFPESVQTLLMYTPFPYLFSGPMRVLMGQAGIVEATQALLMTCAWIVPMLFACRLVLSRGLRNYSGIGI
jgi:ABC-2 type transport system permease protein